MNKSYIIKEIYSGMRIDRWIRNNIASLPQSLIEKSLRKGKIKVNIKKVNSSYKLKAGDKIKFFNFAFEVNKNKETNKKFSPSSELTFATTVAPSLNFNILTSDIYFY